MVEGSVSESTPGKEETEGDRGRLNTYVQHQGMQGPGASALGKEMQVQTADWKWRQECELNIPACAAT